MNIKSCCGVVFQNNVFLSIETEDSVTLNLTTRNYTGATLIDCFKQVIKEVENDG